MVPIEVQGLAVGATELTSVVLLREVYRPHRWLAITMSGLEAQELIAAQGEVTTPRPGTIELLGHVIAAFGNRLVAAEVILLADGTFDAELVFVDGRRVSARPSDAITLALRCKSPITVARAVLEEVAVEVAALNYDPDDETSIAAEAEFDVGQFRAQLDEVTPEDFRDTDPT